MAIDKRKLSLNTLIILAVVVLIIFASSVFSSFSFREKNSSFPEIKAKNPSLGKKNAPVKIIEFGDFSCPYCRLLNDYFNQLYSEYGSEKIIIVWKDFPLYNLHDYSVEAAQAARCAQKQGKFWEMHDLLFKNQSSFSPEFFISLASSLNLDTNKFIKCVNNNETLSWIEEDVKEGKRLGVNGTPHFYVNNYKITELIDYSQLKELVDSFLR